MSGIANFLRGYEFLNLTKSVTESQMALYKEPNTTWAQIGNKFYDICWYNTKSIAMVGADVVTYTAVSSLRKIGLFNPLPPVPPTFATPFDNVQFLNCSLERALWNWDPALKTEMREGIEAGLSNKWNVFQAVAEWSMAYSLENANKGSFFEPTFLTFSGTLSNGETFPSIRKAFTKLWQKDQKALLNALYRQEAAKSLSSSGNKVYDNIRALSSKLHQGNQMYLTAFNEYIQQKEAGSLPVLVAEPAPAPVIPIAAPAPVAATYSINSIVLNEKPGILFGISYLRNALLEGATTLDSYRQKRLLQSVIDDRTRPVNGLRPDSLLSLSPETSPKYFVARLGLLRFFESFKWRTPPECPDFFSRNMQLRNGKTLPEAGRDFGRGITDRDFKTLQNAIVRPHTVSLNDDLRRKLLELSEFADLVHKNEKFLKTYEALQIDLVATE